MARDVSPAALSATGTAKPGLLIYARSAGLAARIAALSRETAEASRTVLRKIRAFRERFLMNVQGGLGRKYKAAGAFPCRFPSSRRLPSGYLSASELKVGAVVGHVHVVSVVGDNQGAAGKYEELRIIISQNTKILSQKSKI